MRIDLVLPVYDQQLAAIAEVTRLARAMHDALEVDGGYAMEHAADIAAQDDHPDSRMALMCLSRHREIQQARRRAIQSMRFAEHGAAIREIIAVFEKELSA